MKSRATFLFLFGFLIGLLSTVTYNAFTKATKTNQHSDLRANTTTMKMRILCYIPTAVKNYGKRAVHVQNTWGKHCDKLIFGSVVTNKKLGSIGLNVTDEYSWLYLKVKHFLHFIHRNYIDEYDWFYKADDDTFAIVENMRYMLSAYSPNDPIYFGHRQYNQKFTVGGSGYVLSNKALRIFAENVLAKGFKNEPSFPWYGEDGYMSKQLYKFGVQAGDPRDPVKSIRFCPAQPDIYYMHYDTRWFWYWKAYYKSEDERFHFSKYTISMHYTRPKPMYEFYFLMYHFRAYGIKRHDSPPPRKLSFAQVVQVLEQQQMNYRMFEDPDPSKNKRVLARPPFPSMTQLERQH